MLMEQASDPIAVLDARDRSSRPTRAPRRPPAIRARSWGMNVTHLFVPSELSEHPLHLPELRAGKTVVTERQVRTKDGSIRIAEVSARLLPDGRIQAIARDITSGSATPSPSVSWRRQADYSPLRSTMRQRSRKWPAWPCPARGLVLRLYLRLRAERTEVATGIRQTRRWPKARRLPAPYAQGCLRGPAGPVRWRGTSFESVHPDMAVIARSPEHLEQMRALGAHSAMLVPMEVRWTGTRRDQHRLHPVGETVYAPRPDAGHGAGPPCGPGHRERAPLS